MLKLKCSTVVCGHSPLSFTKGGHGTVSLHTGLASACGLHGADRPAHHHRPEAQPHKWIKCEAARKETLLGEMHFGNLRLDQSG